MLGFLWRFIALGLDSFWSLVLPEPILFEGLLGEVGDLGVFDLSSRPATTFVDLVFGETLSFAGALTIGVEGTVSGLLGDEGVEDGGGEQVCVGATPPSTAPVLVFIFLARVVRIFSSSSEEG